MDTSSSFDTPSALADRQAAPVRASALAKVGAWLQLGLLMWYVGAHAVILSIFDSVSQLSQDEVARPVEAVNRSFALAGLGICTAMIGCVLLGIAIFGQKRQPVWAKVIFGLALFPALGGLQLLIVSLARL